MTEYAGGEKGFVLKARPRKYPMTEQQKKMRGVIKECGIKKGIKKAELQRLMVECVGPKMQNHQGETDQASA